MKLSAPWGLFHSYGQSLQHFRVPRFSPHDLVPPLCQWHELHSQVLLRGALSAVASGWHWQRAIDRHCLQDRWCLQERQRGNALFLDYWLLSGFRLVVFARTAPRPLSICEYDDFINRQCMTMYSISLVCPIISFASEAWRTDQFLRSKSGSCRFRVSDKVSVATGQGWQDCPWNSGASLPGHSCGWQRTMALWRWHVTVRDSDDMQWWYMCDIWWWCGLQTYFRVRSNQSKCYL